MAKPYEEMTKAELQSAVGFFKLQAELEKVAKYPSKPTNEELIQVLNDFKAKQGTLDPEFVDNGNYEVKVVENGPTAGMTDMDKLAFDLNMLVPVVVTDYDNTQRTEEELENRVVSLRWGNYVIGGTISIALHGRTQYLPKGSIAAIKEVTFPSNYKDATGKEVTDRTKKRFHIAEVEGWTPEELEAHKKEQALKKVSY